MQYQHDYEFVSPGVEVVQNEIRKVERTEVVSHGSSCRSIKTPEDGHQTAAPL